MKTLLLALFAFSASAQAANLTFTCKGRNLILDQINTIEWNQQQITIKGTMNGVAYSVNGNYARTYTNSGFAYSTSYGEVVIPFDLINGARAQADVSISSYDYPNESATCSIAK